MATNQFPDKNGEFGSNEDSEGCTPKRLDLMKIVDSIITDYYFDYYWSNS